MLRRNTFFIKTLKQHSHENEALKTEVMQKLTFDRLRYSTENELCQLLPRTHISVSVLFFKQYSNGFNFINSLENENHSRCTDMQGGVLQMGVLRLWLSSFD